VTELLVGLLVLLDHPGNLAVGHDREDDDAVVLAARLLAHVLGGETAPPPLDLRIGTELDDSRHVRLGQGPQQDSISLQLHDVLVTPTATTLATMRKRLDVVLVERGLAESRAQAQALVLAGLVPGYDKPGHQVAEDVDLHVERPPRFVSRGGEKLANALGQLELALDGRDAVDVGASTGGFTDYLLQHDVARVIAVDVGYGQLHPKLRGDPRVTVLERTNARDLTELPFRPDLLVADVSFISVRIALPPVLRLLQPGWDAVVLVKPQFEAGKGEVARGGVVRDPEIHRRVLREVVDAALDWGGTTVGVVDSGLPGPKGNHEFFVHLINRPDPVLLDDIDQRIDCAVAPV
jgi:23S rRNA (cytidine1920-2'-O)/16S rRNA (cytidine1409-2'-O)-methyltransferase